MNIPESINDVKDQGQQFYDHLQKDKRFKDKSLPKEIIDIVNLFGHADMYKEWDCERFALSVVPPILLGQYNLLYDNEKLVGYSSYALVTPSIDKDVLERRIRPLSQDEWDCGPVIWLVDVVAPFGHGMKAAHNLIKSIPRATIDKQKKRARTQKLYVKFWRFYGDDKRIGKSLLPY
jgi:hemolysin-activating ACP:hemolysin acyltransferase